MDGTQRYWDDIDCGAELSAIEPMPSQRLVVWAAASGDYYQIHYDDEFAAGNKLPGIIVHGALKGMIVGRLLEEWCGAGGRIVNWKVSYRGMDPARHDLRFWARVTRKYLDAEEGRIDLDVGVEQPDGSETTPGSATVALPRRG